MPADIIAANAYGPTSFSATAQTVTNSLILLATIQLGGNRQAAILDINNSGAALTHLKITRAAKAGGTHVDWIVDTDFDTKGNEIISSTPKTGLSTLGTPIRGQVKLGNLLGTEEIAVYAQCATSTTVDVSGTVE